MSQQVSAIWLSVDPFGHVVPMSRPFRRKEQAMLLYAASTAEMPQRAAKAQLVVSKLREWRVAFEANALLAGEQEVDEDFLDTGTDERPVEGMVDTVDGGGLVDTVAVTDCENAQGWEQHLLDTRMMKRFKVDDWVRCCSAERVAGD
jgi:hypothetical protein